MLHFHIQYIYIYALCCIHIPIRLTSHSGGNGNSVWICVFDSINHAPEGHDEEIDGANERPVRDTALLGAVT